jgi:hypothetical protein
MEGRHNSKPSLLGLPLFVIGAVAFCVVLPFSWLGIPSGHDFEFHFNSWLEVVAHWKEGDIYPHWAALAHYGYGEARFIFYPPISWTLGAILGLILPWKLVPAAYIGVALTLCGVSMFLLARRWLSRNDALLAAVIYAANPYHLVIVYWRSAMAELLAAAYLPLLLLFVLRSEEDGGPRIVAPLSLLLAAGWLTNVPTAVMMNYSLALFVLWTAISRKSWKVLAYAGIAVILGGALAGVYLVPVLHQQKWVDISQVLAPGVRPVDNFLFVNIADADHNRFNRLVSVVALCEIVIVAALLIFSRRWRWRSSALWRLMLAWGLLCSVLMIRFTLPLWTHLPELRYVQLPWRWLLCLNVVFASGVLMAFKRWWLRALVCVIALGSVLWVWHRVLPPWWDNAGDIQEMVDNQQDGAGNEGTDEYVPAGVDPYDVDQKAPPARFEGRGSAKIHIVQSQSEKRLIVAVATSPGKLVLRLFNYPSWRVEVNGRAVQTESTPHTGQMVVPVTAGENRVEVRFVEGWDRLAGGGISALAILIIILWFVRHGMRRDGPMMAES